MTTRYTWADEEPRPPRARSYYHSDPNVTLAHGQHFRRESSIVVPDFTVSQGEQRILGELAREAAEARLADRGRRLFDAVRLGAALRAQGH